VALVTAAIAASAWRTAKRFVAEGAHCLSPDAGQQNSKRRRKRCSNVTSIQGDVAKLADLDRVFAQIKREKGKLDIVFANAGGRGTRAYWRNYGRAVRSDVRHQCQRTVVHRPESLASDSAGGSIILKRLDRSVPKESCVERLQRDQGRGTVVRAHVTMDLKERKNPSQCASARVDHIRRLRRLAESGPAGQQMLTSIVNRSDGRFGTRINRQGRGFPRLR